MRTYVLKNLLLLSLLLLMVFAFSASITLAQGSFVELANVDGSKLEGIYSSSEGDLSVFVGRLFTFALSIGAMLAILRIGWAGYLYMASDLWTSKEKARETFRDTALGLLLLLAVYIILFQINPDILEIGALLPG